MPRPRLAHRNHPRHAGRGGVTVGERPTFRMADLRKAIPEWIKLGATVKFDADGSVTVNPPAPPTDDPFDQVNLKR